MRKTYITYCAACALLLGLVLGVGSSRAQEPAATTDGTAAAAEKPQTGIRKLLRKDTKEVRVEAQAEKKGIITETKAKNEALRAENKELMQKPKENRAVIKENRAEMKDNRVDARGDIKAIKKDARGEIKDLRASTTDAIKKKSKGELQKKLDIKAREKTIRHFGQAISKLESAAARIHALIKKTESRLAKFAEKGVDTTEPSALLAQAKNLNISAGKAIEQAKIDIKAAASSEATHETAESIRASLKAAETSVREAHKLVADAINSLKPGQNKPKEGTATTTPPTATTTATQ